MQNLDEILALLSVIAEAIGRTFGKTCEVVVHDLRDLDHTIVRIINGHITGRKVGGSLTDMALKQLRSGPLPDLLVNYPSQVKKRKPLKSTTVCIKDDEGKPIAALCINLDISSIADSRDILDEICRFSNRAHESDLETFQKDIRSTLKEVLRNEIEKFGKLPNEMDRSEKISLLEAVERKGLFLVKGSVSLAAKELNVSRFTIYNYLAEIRGNQGTVLFHKK